MLVSGTALVTQVQNSVLSVKGRTMWVDMARRVKKEARG